MSVSFVEGGKRFFTIKKEYGQESANDLRSILGLSVFRDCRKYFKIKGNSGEVCLNTNSILDKSEFMNCLEVLFVIAHDLLSNSNKAKKHCRRLIDSLISYGQEKGFTNDLYTNIWRRPKTSKINNLIEEIDRFLNTHRVKKLRF